MAGCADIEQACGVAELYGEGAHEERRCFDKGVAKIFHGRFAASVGKEVLEDRDNSFRCLGGINDEQNDVTYQKSYNDADERSEECLESGSAQK